MAGKQEVKIRFNDISRLTDRETQLFLREIDTKVLAAAMKGARKPVRQRIFQNVSSRVAVLIQEETRRVDGSRAPAAREKAGKIVADQVEKGLIQWPPKGSIPKPRKMPKSYWSKKRQTLAASKNLESLDDLDAWLVGLAEIARAEGILELNKALSATPDGLSEAALRLIVDGVEPGLAREILENLAESCLREQEIKYRKVIEGVLSIQAGQNPRIIEQKLAVIY